MSSKFKSFFSYTRKERIGIAGLTTLITLIFAANFCIKYFVQPKVNIDEEKLNLAWQKIQAAQKNVSEESLGTATTTELTYFDPNTLDSLGFIRLGLNSRTIHYLLNWRSKGKHFYQKEDLKTLYSLSESEYKRLAPFIQIKQTEKSENHTAYVALAPLPAHININQTDSATLVRLDGIGTFIAHKIIERRNALGGFLKHEQLLEIYKFSDSTFAYLKEKLLINPSEIKKIKLNSVTEEQLKIHPYIGEKMAKNIIILRNGLKKYEKIEQLKQVPLMNEEKYRKIAVYCTID